MALGVLAALAVLGAQAFPTVVEYQAVLKAVQKASAGSTVTSQPWARAEAAAGSRRMDQAGRQRMEWSRAEIILSPGPVGSQARLREKMVSA